MSYRMVLRRMEYKIYLSRLSWLYRKRKYGYDHTILFISTTNTITYEIQIDQFALGRNPQWVCKLSQHPPAGQQNPGNFQPRESNGLCIRYRIGHDPPLFINRYFPHPTSRNYFPASRDFTSEKVGVSELLRRSG